MGHRLAGQVVQRIYLYWQNILFPITRPAGGEHCVQADAMVLCVIMNSASWTGSTVVLEHLGLVVAGGNSCYPQFIYFFFIASSTGCGVKAGGRLISKQWGLDGNVAPPTAEPPPSTPPALIKLPIAQRNCSVLFRSVPGCMPGVFFFQTLNNVCFYSLRAGWATAGIMDNRSVGKTLWLTSLEKLEKLWSFWLWGVLSMVMDVCDQSSNIREGFCKTQLLQFKIWLLIIQTSKREVKETHS